MALDMITIEVKHTGTGFSKREWGKYLSEAWREAAHEWHDKILPKHFTHAGATEYQYDKRSPGNVKGYTKKGDERRYPSYATRKFKKWGHSYPLVWTGKTRSDALRYGKITHTQKGATISLKVPFYIMASVLQSGHPDMAQELRTISDADAAFLAAVVDKALQRQIDESDRGSDKLYRTGGFGSGHETE